MERDSVGKESVVESLARKLPKRLQSEYWDIDLTDEERKALFMRTSRLSTQATKWLFERMTDEEKKKYDEMCWESLRKHVSY